MLDVEYYCCVKNKNFAFAKNFYELIKLLSDFHLFLSIGSLLLKNSIIESEGLLLLS